MAPKHIKYTVKFASKKSRRVIDLETKLKVIVIARQSAIDLEEQEQSDGSCYRTCFIESNEKQKFEKGLYQICRNF